MYRQPFCAVTHIDSQTLNLQILRLFRRLIVHHLLRHLSLAAAPRGIQRLSLHQTARSTGQIKQVN